MLSWLAVALLLVPQPAVERDVAYGEDGDKADADYAQVCEPFPAAGFGCASINYRLAPQHAWPSHPPVLRTNKKFSEDARALGNHAEYEVLAGRRHYTAIRRLHEPNDAAFQRVLAFLRKFTQ